MTPAQLLIYLIVVIITKQIDYPQPKIQKASCFSHYIVAINYKSILMGKTGIARKLIT